MKIIITENQLSTLVTKDLPKGLINQLFGKFFKDFTVGNYNGYVHWVRDGNNESSFGKNRWGNFFIHSEYCDDWLELRRIKRNFGLSTEEFYEYLITYLNETFSDYFTGGNLVRGIKDEQCNRLY
jgi:hypothetical protein